MNDFKHKNSTLREIIFEPQNYKIILKGLGSKNQYVFASIYKIITLLGSFDLLE